MIFSNEGDEKLAQGIDEINKKLDELNRELESKFSETTTTPKSTQNPQLEPHIDDDPKVQEALNSAEGDNKNLLLLLQRSQRLLKKAIWLQETTLKALSVRYVETDTGKTGPLAIVMGPRKPPQDPD